MKKIISIFLIIMCAISCMGCSKNGITSNNSQPYAENSMYNISKGEDTSEHDDLGEKPEVNNDGFCIVVKMKTSGIKIENPEDFSKFTVGYISDTDSEIYAKFYNFKESGMYNSGHDLHSGLMGGLCDLGIINDVSYQANIDDYEIVWDFSTNNN